MCPKSQDNYTYVGIVGIQFTKNKDLWFLGVKLTSMVQFGVSMSCFQTFFGGKLSLNSI